MFSKLFALNSEVTLANFKAPGSRCGANWVFCLAMSLTCGYHFVPQFLLLKWGVMILAFVCEYLLQLGLISDSSQMGAQDH